MIVGASTSNERVAAIGPASSGTSADLPPKSPAKTIEEGTAAASVRLSPNKDEEERKSDKCNHNEESCTTAQQQQQLSIAEVEAQAHQRVDLLRNCGEIR